MEYWFKGGGKQSHEGGVKKKRGRDSLVFAEGSDFVSFKKCLTPHRAGPERKPPDKVKYVDPGKKKQKSARRGGNNEKAWFQNG